jgi:hypothetical protein
MEKENESGNKMKSEPLLNSGCEKDKIVENNKKNNEIESDDSEEEYMEDSEYETDTDEETEENGQSDLIFDIDGMEVIKTELEKLNKMDRKSFYNELVSSKSCKLKDYVHLLDVKNNNDDFGLLREEIQNKNGFLVRHSDEDEIFIKFRVRDEDNWMEVNGEELDDVIYATDASIWLALTKKNNKRNSAVDMQIANDIHAGDFVRNAPIPEFDKTDIKPNLETEKPQTHGCEIKHNHSYSELSNVSENKVKNTLGYNFSPADKSRSFSISSQISESYMMDSIHSKIQTSMKELMNVDLNEMNKAIRYIGSKRGLFQSNLFVYLNDKIRKYQDTLAVYKEINVVPFKRLVKKDMLGHCKMDDKITNQEVAFLIDLSYAELDYVSKNSVNLREIWNTSIDLDYIIS